MNHTLLHGDCLEVMPTLPDNSIGAIITDPPYELSFMGKKWDGTGIAYNIAVWRECLRVLKPGGYLLAFGGTRTSHRMVCAIEDAGFYICDRLRTPCWVYGSGFPKSLDISKAIDKEAGIQREVIGVNEDFLRRNPNSGASERGIINKGHKDGLQGAQITAPATDAAKQWEGWGTALRPSWEPLCMARKPLAEPTYAANVQVWGTGGINIDAGRIGNNGGCRGATSGASNGIYGNGLNGSFAKPVEGLGRWPANVILSPFDAAQIDAQSGVTKSAGASQFFHTFDFELGELDYMADFAPLYYVAKASQTERHNGHEDGGKNTHPTVKPRSMISHLCRLITPLGETILDPFSGSFTTILAAYRCGFDCIGIEKEAEYIAIGEKRLAHAKSETGLFAASADAPKPNNEQMSLL